jgi:hypothetical protein
VNACIFALSNANLSMLADLLQHMQPEVAAATKGSEWLGRKEKC